MKKIIYQLTVEDIQIVAEKEIGRNLSSEEIELLRDGIAEKISWYDVLAESIGEMIVEPKRHKHP